MTPAHAARSCCQHHQVEKVPFMMAHPITSLFLTVVTGGLALLVLPFMTSNRSLGGHCKVVPFVAEYPLTSLTLILFTGGLAIVPLALMTANKAV